MFDPKKPIFQRGVKPATPAQPKSAAPVTELTPEQLALKKAQHDDGWLHDHKDTNVRVKFIDGEVLEGTVGKVRKFAFNLHTSTGSVMCFKIGIKYVAENEVL